MERQQAAQDLYKSLNAAAFHPGWLAELLAKFVPLDAQLPFMVGVGEWLYLSATAAGIDPEAE